MLLGRIQADESTGLQLSVQTGDVIILPAGTAHSSLESSPDYRYIGVYPQVSCERIQGRRFQPDSWIDL
jgi:uncharacterized protein YjlB